MALRRSAANLPPEELQKQVAPVQGKVGDVDPAALAAKAVARIVEKSEVCGMFLQKGVEKEMAFARVPCVDASNLKICISVVVGGCRCWLGFNFSLV